MEMFEMATNRERLLFLLKTLMDNTDGTHDYTMKDLEKLYQANGISGTAKTIRKDYQQLKDMGFHVSDTPDPGRATVYSYEQAFEGAELRMIIDAVSAAKFISPSNARKLIEKLVSLASKPDAEEFSLNADTAWHNESPNKNFYVTIQVISDAIAANKKISYQYYDYGLDKKMVLRNNGETYIYSPYGFAWNEDRYYLLGQVDKRPGVINPVRVDLLWNVKILDETAVASPEGFNVRKYSDKVFKMFGGEETEVILEADNSLVKKFVDRFGDGFSISKATEDTFYATVNVSVSPTFFSWVFQYNGQIRVAGPQEVRDQYSGMLSRLLAYYSKLGEG